VRRVAAALAAAVALAACQGREGSLGPAPGTPPASAPSAVGEGGRLDERTAWVTVVVRRDNRRLPEARARDVLAAVRLLLRRVTSLSPRPDGPGLLTTLRLSEDLVDVTVWTPQTLLAGTGPLRDVSGIVIPLTGPYRHRVLVVREGRVAVSRDRVDAPPIDVLEQAVEAVRSAR